MPHRYLRVIGPASTTIARRHTILAAALGALFAGCVLLGLARAADADTGIHVQGLVTTYDHPTNAIEVMLVKGDGQIFGALARDPSLSHPDVFRYGDFDAAYRAQRPLAGYLTWMLSAGQPALVPAALVLLGIAGAALASGAISASGRGRHWLGGVLVVSPAGIATLYSLTPELLAAGLAISGLVAHRTRRPWTAVALFTLAALGRETMLLFPLVIAAHTGARRQRPDVRLVVPFAGWGAWYLFVRWHFGVKFWPLSTQGDLGTPFVELVRAMPEWGAFEAITFGLALVATAVAVRGVLAHRDDLLAWTAVAFAAVSTTFGASIWDDWLNSGRLFVPLYALALAMLSGERRTALAPESPA